MVGNAHCRELSDGAEEVKVVKDELVIDGSMTLRMTTDEIIRFERQSRCFLGNNPVDDAEVSSG